jgi:hypothetical protein
MFMPNSPRPPRGIAKREGLSNVARFLIYQTHYRITRASGKMVAREMKSQSIAVPADMEFSETKAMV